MLLTVDIGTSFFKSAVWDYNGSRKAFASVPLSITLNDGLRYETDSSQWLAAFGRCCQILSSSVPLKSAEAIIISGNGPSLAPVLDISQKSTEKDKYFIVHAAPVRLWLDRRAEEAAKQVSEITGSHIDAGFFLPKILDIQKNEPELYEQTKFFLGCPEFLAYALTKEARTVFPSKGFERWFWNDSLLEKLDLDMEKFPTFIRPSETFGTLVPYAACHYGLKPDIPVICGGPDFYAAILGAGVVKPGQACDRAGTSEGINTCIEKKVNDNRLMCYGHPVKPFWNLSGVVSTTGKAVEWARDLLGLDSYEAFTALAKNAEAGAGGLTFLPYLAGERIQVRNPGTRGKLHNISLTTRRCEFARSVLEGIGFAIREIIAAMEKTDAVVDELRIAGAASASSVLNQIKADITGRPVQVLRQCEAELSGLAIIGACALEKYSSFAEAAAELVHVEKTFLPNENNVSMYNDMFEKYQQMKDNN